MKAVSNLYTSDTFRLGNHLQHQKTFSEGKSVHGRKNQVLAQLFSAPSLNFEAISCALEKNHEHTCVPYQGWRYVPGCEVCKFLRQPLYKHAPRHEITVLEEVLD